VTSQVPNLPGPRPGAAVSHDGTLLYVAGGNTFAVYGRPVVPGTAPTQLRSGTVGFSGDGFQAVAPQPDGSRIWAYAETAPGSFAIFMVMDGNPPKPSGGPTSAPGYGVLFYLGMAPAGNVLYFANGDAGDVYGFEVTALHQLVQLGSVNTGMQAACGAAVAPNGDVYSATTISAIRYAPGPRSGNPILTEQGRRQITQGWDGNEMQGLAFGGGVLWVLTTNFAVPCDPVSLTPLRDPIPMTHSGIACSADGLRLYVVDWNTGPALYEYAPTTMSGGVAGHGGDES
jgi:DNA-binding beta-propeller fold protein YncE